MLHTSNPPWRYAVKLAGSLCSFNLKTLQTIRLSVLCFLICVGLGAALFSSCRSSYRPIPIVETPTVEPATEDLKKDLPAAPAVGDRIALAAQAESTPQPSGDKPSEESEGMVKSDEHVGIKVGIEVWQGGVIVKNIKVGQVVQFKLTTDSTVGAPTTGCSINPGIIQTSWTIGGRAAYDVQRTDEQDCQTFDYSGVFTTPGAIKVSVDILSKEGSHASHSETISVMSAATGA